MEEKIIQKTVYLAKDGKEFLNKEECRKYEEEFLNKISTSIETEPRQYPKMCGVFVAYEVRRWYRKKELKTRYVHIRIGA